MELEDFNAIDGATIRGESVELSKKTRINSIYNSTLVDCSIVLDPKGMPASRFGARFEFGKTILDQCMIRADGRIHKLTVAESVVFKNCKFIGGPFTEPVLGSGILADSKNIELLHNCDFTECDLRDARFYSTSIEQLKLPGWPFITVIARDGERVYAQPSKIYPGSTTLRDDVRAFDWCDQKLAKFIEIIITTVGNGLSCPNVYVSHAEFIVKLGGINFDVINSELDRFAHPALRY